VRILLITCLLVPIQLLAGAITGKISSEKTGQPLLYVNISAGNGHQTVSGQGGRFFIGGLERGSYSVSFSYVGYEQKTIENIEIKEDDQHLDLGKIKLTPKSFQIPEVTITTVTTNFNDKYSSTNNLISQVELEQIQPIGSEEVLRTVPGLHVAGDMGLSNRLNVGIRGSYPRRSEKVLLLEDGIPIAPAPYLAPEAYYNPPTDRLDGIEVIKGADVLTYGNNTMYGVINYITKRPPAKPTLSGTLTHGENGYNSMFLAYGSSWDKVGAEIQVLSKSFDGFRKNAGASIFNTTGKIYMDLGKRSTLYIKLNYHQENAKATYSGLTPYTFRTDPTENPFDADDLSTWRQAIDVVHRFRIGERLTLITQAYGSRFQRDWWRQDNTLVAAGNVRSYVGDDIFFDRYDYVKFGGYFGEDLVRVGKVVNGTETAKARNRTFGVEGLHERIQYDWELGKMKNQLEVGMRYHAEQFHKKEIKTDEGRFDRDGELILDQKYNLFASSMHIRNNFGWDHFSIAPVARYEWISMTKYNLLIDPDEFILKNTFTAFLPGISVNLKIRENDSSSLSIYSNLYKGYTPPTASFGFMSVDSDVTNKSPEPDEVNMKPEYSTNFDAGIRGLFFNNLFNGQVAWFNNNIRNFYAAGRKEAFESLGAVNINGFEIAVSTNLGQLIPAGKHKLKLTSSLTFLRSRIVGGRMADSDLLKLNHTPETIQEMIDKINTERSGYNVYFADDVMITRQLTADDFPEIEKVEMVFGNGGIVNNRAPYVPEYYMNFGITYGVGGLTVGANYNLIGEQYTDYFNFDNESVDGALGKLNAYNTLDLNMSLAFPKSKHRFTRGLTVFVVGKNVTNKIYKASRLHRLSSGIMPGGFRQVNGGVRFLF
jgi:Fe(3+) dicitrate transport protein